MFNENKLNNTYVEWNHEHELGSLRLANLKLLVNLVLFRFLELRP